MKSELSQWLAKDIVSFSRGRMDGRLLKSPVLSRKETVKRHLVKMGIALILGAGIATPSMSQPPPIVGTPLSSQHDFLTFSSGNLESPPTSKAYYQTIDPTGAKVDFRDWLVNAGFISSRADWKSTGQQTYTNVPGDYGYGKVNAYSHIIILNVGDLGFIRNQYIRCNPDCKTPGARIYTYLENYAVPDSAAGNLDLTRKSVNTALEQRVGRVADVAFEWAPAADGSNPSTLFGQLYAYIVQPKLTNVTCPSTPAAPSVPNKATGTPVLDASGNPVLDELYIWPSDNGNNQKVWDCNLNTRNLLTTAPEFLKPRPEFLVYSGDDFAPELDGLGTKAMPGVCMVCHGGNLPKNIQSTLAWPNSGNLKEFKFLPADADNAIFGIDDSGASLVAGATGSNMTRAGQEIELKKYNQAVVLTHGATPPKNAFFAADGTIAGGNWTYPKVTSKTATGKTTRPAHGAEVVFGWYAGFPGDFSMSGNVQNGNFVPVGWQTTAEAQNLYLKVVEPSCRSCHMTREPSLDLGTAAQFDGNKGNVQNYVFQPECDALLNEVKPGKIVMPLAKLTWDRFWNGVDHNTNLAFDSAHTLAANDPNSPAFLLKQHFGYTATSYCASKH